ncbi:hypothetical protein Pelo_9913 [Pelomyxa schiedti]|nr:hypothetical protein Pelo_9913 [Pelomyxa schiedti]
MCMHARDLLVQAEKLVAVAHTRQQTIKQSTTVYVLGHTEPDVDSSVSTFLATELLNWCFVQNGNVSCIDIVPAVLTPQGSETRAICEAAGVPRLTNVVPLESLIADSWLFLVDHNRLKDSIGTTRTDLNIFGIVDHHDDDMVPALFRRVKEAGCASMVVLELMEDIGFPVHRNHKKAALYALYVDTCCLLSSSTIPSDREKGKEWRLELDITEHTLLNDTVHDVDFIDTPTNELATNGLKKYSFKNFRIGTSTMEAKRKASDSVTCALQRVTEYIAERLLSSYDLYIVVFRDYQTGTTSLHLHGAMAYFIEERNGGPLTFEGFAGRNDVIMRRVFELLETY